MIKLRNYFNFEVNAMGDLSKRPESGEKVLIHGFNREEGDIWELVEYYEEGAIVDCGYDIPETLSPAERAMAAIAGDYGVRQLINESGFYFCNIDSKDNITYIKLDETDYQQWVRLPETQIIK